MKTIADMPPADKAPIAPKAFTKDFEAPGFYYQIIFGIVIVVFLIVGIDLCYMVDGTKITNSPYYLEKT